jgi:hypothetical protein
MRSLLIIIRRRRLRAGKWRDVARVVGQFGQVVDVFVSPRQDA